MHKNFNIFFLFATIKWVITWAIPPIITPKPKYHIICSFGKFLEISKATIKEILSKVVEKAVTAKWFLYCKILARNVTIKIKSKYQKLSAIRGEASFFAFSSNPYAKNSVTKSLKIVTIKLKISIITKNLIKIKNANLAFSFDLARLGKKLCVKAPSAKILLKRFGNLNATKNISEYMFAPSIEALNKSLINPNILELNIPKKLIIIDLNISGIISKKAFNGVF